MTFPSGANQTPSCSIQLRQDGGNAKEITLKDIAFDIYDRELQEADYLK